MPNHTSISTSQSTDYSSIHVDRYAFGELFQGDGFSASLITACAGFIGYGEEREG
jgi:hypothetical protein